jgi:hypothetical protein
LSFLSDTIATDWTVIPEVTYEPWPPTSGSQRCLGCFGWICSVMYYIENEGPYCPPCWRKFNDEENENGK